MEASSEADPAVLDRPALTAELLTLYIGETLLQKHHWSSATN